MRLVLLCLLLLLGGGVVHAEPKAGDAHREQLKGLDEQVQEVKGDVLGIAAELNRLEEKLLFPSGTQLSLFVSLDPADKFRLDAVDILLDGKPIAHHLYTFKELEAMQQGGVQRIYTGNVTTGEHELRVSLAGKEESGSDYRRWTTAKFVKEVGPRLLEIRLVGPAATESIGVKPW